MKIKEIRKPKQVNNIQLYMSELDADEKYISRFSVEKLMNNRLSMLNSEFDLDLVRWNVPAATPLWNFNLHYLEYLIVLADEYSNTGDKIYYDKFKEILNSWMNVNNDFKGPGWQPYTISLRIPNILICLDLFDDIFDQDINFKEKVYGSIYNQYIFLRNNQEKHLLGNHYFENLNTIVICSMLFNEKKTYDYYIQKYISQIKEQILSDGLHFERSIMYHKIILERIIRTYNLLKNYDNTYDTYFEEVITRMADALISLEKGMGKIPHFNDSADGISKSTDQLINAVKQVIDYSETFKNEFQNSGYYKLYSDDIALMFDVGEIGPSYMAGHGHNDVLSFEISKNERPVFVNSGTYNYQSSLRNFFRSTEAHNTLMIADTQQSQVWGEHRVAKRISNIKCEEIINGYVGSFANYRGMLHQRKIKFRENNILFIEDTVKAKENQLVRSFFHLAPGLKIKRTNKQSFQILNTHDKVICIVKLSRVVDSIIHKDGILTNYSEKFGKLTSKEVLEYRWNSIHKSSEVYIIFSDDIRI